MVLVILAGITLNAVIGEDGIIFQAKDTKNMITNETEYDNEQLAALQNELRDNQLYTGIGIIPGTDTGGSSEGGESGSGGSGGSGNQGGGGGTNTNTGGSDGELVGGDAVAPTIRVIEGEEIAASFYRSDVTVQISTYDKTQKIKYILTTTVDEINDELYPSGLIKEIDIENGGTLTFTKDGEYTITAYSYDVRGNKSNSSIMWLKRETGTTTGSGVTVSVASGNMGQNDWYTSNITLRVLGTDTGSSRVTYRVRGTAYSNGTIGNREYMAGEVDTGEIDIANGTTFRIAIDGEFAIVAYTYDSGGMRLSTAPTLNVRRDATRPVITLYKGEQIIGSGFQISVIAEDAASDLASEGRYTYRHKLAPNMTYTDNLSQETTQLYAGLEQDKTYDMYVIVKDEAGNMTASDVISKPALWVTAGTQGESNGEEGLRKYYRSDVTINMIGQDENNVDISRVTYQIIGTTTGAGNMDGSEYEIGTAVSEDEREMGNTKTLLIQADGNWIIKVHTYNKENERVSTNTLEVTRDMVGPVISTFETASVSEGQVKVVSINTSDATSSLATNNDAYQYLLGDTIQSTSGTASHTYTGININTVDTIKVRVKDRAGNTTDSETTAKTYYLADLVALGDYVEYNAGTWDSTVANPTSNATFGGYTEGQNKGTSVTGNTSGWRVLSKTGSGSTGTVTLISAGSPALGYYGNSDANRTAMITGLNNFATNNFLNTSLATSARNADTNDYGQMNTAGVRVTGNNYWLATSAGNNSGRRYSGSGTSYTGYMMTYRISTAVWTNYTKGTFYSSTSSSSVSVAYRLHSVNSAGNYPTTSYSGNSRTSYRASSTYYYYLYSEKPTGSYNNYSPTGSRLWRSTNTSDSPLYRISSASYNGSYNQAYGVRPVVVLKSGLKTDGLISYLNQNSWSII